MASKLAPRVLGEPYSLESDHDLLKGIEPGVGSLYSKGASDCELRTAERRTRTAVASPRAEAAARRPWMDWRPLRRTLTEERERVEPKARTAARVAVEVSAESAETIAQRASRTAALEICDTEMVFMAAS